MSSATIGDVAYSLSLRPSYPHRHICLVTSLEDAGDKLQAIILKDREVDGAAFQQAACSDQLETTLAVLLSALDGDDSGGQRVTSLHRQASLWHKGAAVDFSVLYQSQTYNKVPLPAYVFVKEKLWIEPAALPAEERHSTASSVNKDEILAPSKPNLYCYEWRAQPVILNNATQNNLSASLDSESLSSQLIFWDGGGVAKARYQQSNDCINVIDAKAFSQQSESQFTLQMESAEQLKELAETLIIQKRSVSVIEYCAFLDIPNQAQNLSSSSAEELLRWQQRLLRLVDFVKEVGRRNSQLPLLRVYFNQAFSVTGTESISPVARALAAMLVVINQELAEFKVQVVDVEQATTANLLANVQAHLNSTHFNTENHTQLAEYRDEVFYVIRGRKLWTRVFRQVDSSGAGTDLFNRESTVVFIGGLGQVGQEASKHLSMLSKHLIIIGRKDVAQLDSSAQSALKRMQMINSQVEYRSVDISDGDQLRSSLRDIAQEKGTINLLIHGAGDMHREKMCSHDQSNTDDLLDQHQAKVKGSLNLLAASSEIDIEHIVATSSLSASLGGLGMMAYAAANAYMDALAENTNATCRWYSVDFDGLAGVKTLGDSSQRDDIYIRPDQLVELTTYLLNRHEPGLWLYAHGELNERWQRSIKKLNFSPRNDDSQERKEFADEEIESELIALYEKLTGHEGIQPTDNFFGVGGDSVTATQLRMLIEKDFLVDISIESIFDHPVVSELTELIKTGRAEVDDSDDELAKLLEQVEQMDELDTERLLEESS
ncbi:MAG: SDR family NAD(P)-dependent oxidoreductase [Arenicella sp.]|nr:SDR family NAD(P)-dependent oxidoreductase [Arenicella sp.]